MALAAAIVWEVRNGGSDTNGGGFRTGASGTDHTQQDAAQYSVTDAVTDGSTTITSATANFGTDVVGNVLYIQGGSGSITAGWYEITARNSATSITVDRSTGLTAGTGATLRIGGAFASPAVPAGIMVAGNDVFIKYHATPYTISSSSSNVANGRIAATVGGVDSTNASYWVGYDSTRTRTNTDANRPTLQATTGSITMFSLTGNYGCVRNISLDGNSQTSIVGFDANPSYLGLVERVHATGCTSYGIRLRPSGGGIYGAGAFLSATGCSGTTAIDLAGAFLFASEAYGNTTTGFTTTNAVLIRCIASGNTGGSSNGFALGGFQGASAYGCIAYGNGAAGFLYSGTGSWGASCYNNIAYGNGTYGFRSSAVLEQLAGSGNFVGNNTTANVSNMTYLTATTLSGDPFTNAASGDFSLNNTSGAGASCRAAGVPATFPRGTTASYMDAGAAQHQDAGGGSGGIFATGGLSGGFDG